MIVVACLLFDDRKLDLTRNHGLTTALSLVALLELEPLLLDIELVVAQRNGDRGGTVLLSQ